MGKFVDFAKIAIVKILFRYLRDERAQLRFIFRQDRAEQCALPVFHLHPLLQLQRIRADRKAALSVTLERRDIQRDVQSRKLTAGGEQRVDVQPLDLRAINNQVRHLHQELTQPGNIKRAQRASAPYFFAFDGLNDQIARQVHVQWWQSHDRLLLRTPLDAAFPQHDKRAKDGIVFNHHAQLLSACAISHALHQQPVDPSLRPGHFDPVEYGISGLLYLGRSPQV